MKITVLGAGQVGASLAESLVNENNDVTIVDTNMARLTELQNKHDIGTVRGHAAHPNILKQAGTDSADMLIAVTNNDETNMMACQVAHTLFQTPTKFARIRSRHYLTYEDELFDPDHIPIDVIFSPEQLVMKHIRRLIDFPGTLQVLSFADDKINVVVIKPESGSYLVGKTPAQLDIEAHSIPQRIVALYRDDHAWPVASDTEIYAGDELFCVVDAEHTQALLRKFDCLPQENKSVLIAGGGNIGKSLAMELEKNYHVKLIDHNEAHTKRLSETLHNTIVLQGDCSDQDLLREEHVEAIDVFCAVTNDDEANIMSALLAKRMGVRQVMALVNRTTYVDLIEELDIDIVISPQLITIGSILTHIRHGDVVRVYSIRRGAAEAMEVVAHGDPETSKVVGRRIDQISFPPDAQIGAIARGNQIIIAQHDTVIESDDHVVVLLTDKKHINYVQQLFEVDVTFL